MKLTGKTHTNGVSTITIQTTTTNSTINICLQKLFIPNNAMVCNANKTLRQSMTDETFNTIFFCLTNRTRNEQMAYIYLFDQYLSLFTN